MYALTWPALQQSSETVDRMVAAIDVSRHPINFVAYRVLQEPALLSESNADGAPDRSLLVRIFVWVPRAVRGRSIL